MEMGSDGPCGHPQTLPNLPMLPSFQIVKKDNLALERRKLPQSGGKLIS
jgi:hypothetical protein